MLVIAGTKRDDTPAIRREHRVAIEIGMIGEACCGTGSVCIHAPDIAARLRPGDVDNGATIGRPRGVELGQRGCREAMRRTLGERHDVDVRQRREHQPLAVRALRWRLNQPRADRAFVLANTLAQIRTHRQIDVHIEGNCAHAAAGKIDAVDEAAVVEHDRFAVGRKRIARNQIAGGAGLLIVALDGIDQPRVLVISQVADAKAGLALEARGVREEPAIGRNLRPKGAALRVDHRLFIARLQVAANDMP